MSALKNHPEMWLRDDAAAAFNAFEDKYGVHEVNSAGRSVAEQQEAINRWNRGGPQNRPPYLYRPADPPQSSPHVANGGIAVDMAATGSIQAQMAEFGFQWYGPGDPVHYNFTGWNGGSGSGDEKVRQEQAFLNAARGESLTVDGIRGPLTIAATKRYQEVLRGYGYTGAIDGIWGDGTQAAHARYYAEWDAARQPAQPAGDGAEPAGDPGGYNPFGIRWSKGLQKIARLNGYTGGIDAQFGAGSMAGFAAFLRANWGYAGNDVLGPVMWAAIARWLRARWGYEGNDVPGPVMRAALSRAEAENYKAL